MTTGVAPMRVRRCRCGTAGQVRARRRPGPPPRPVPQHRPGSSAPRAFGGAVAVPSAIHPSTIAWAAERGGDPASAAARRTASCPHSPGHTARPGVRDRAAGAVPLLVRRHVGVAGSMRTVTATTTGGRVAGRAPPPLRRRSCRAAAVVLEQIGERLPRRAADHGKRNGTTVRGRGRATRRGRQRQLGVAGTGSTRCSGPSESRPSSRDKPAGLVYSSSVGVAAAEKRHGSWRHHRTIPVAGASGPGRPFRRPALDARSTPGRGPPIDAGQPGRIATAPDAAATRTSEGRARHGPAHPLSDPGAHPDVDAAQGRQRRRGRSMKAPVPLTLRVASDRQRCKCFTQVLRFRALR